MRYRVVVVVEAPAECVVSNDALMSAVVGAFEPQATEVVSVDVEQLPVPESDSKRAQVVEVMRRLFDSGVGQEDERVEAAIRALPFGIFRDEHVMDGT